MTGVQPIKVVVLEGNLVELLEPISVTIGTETITVPAGYVTDLLSIPGPLHWWIRPTHRRALRAAIVHDWIYHTHMYPRVMADAIFEVILREDGVSRRRVKLFSVAVRTFGKRSYMRGPETLMLRTPHLAHHVRQTPAIEFRAADLAA